jgi:hypothetical protein
VGAFLHVEMAGRTVRYLNFSVTLDIPFDPVLRLKLMNERGDVKSFDDPFNDIFELDIVPNQHSAAFGKIGFEFEQFGGGLAAVFDIAE